jgi:5-hydroxyisourate hydrolase-like protein (transthyretin family)
MEKVYFYHGKELFIIKVFDMKTINESTIRRMVAESLKNILSENYFGEYRTKGSLNKKTLDKNAGKSADEIIADRERKAAEDAEASKWAETADDVLNRWKENEPEEFDDSKAGGDYKIDFANPYFYDKDGERVDADAIGNFHNDFAIVKKDGKVNYVDNEGQILSDEWFDACNDFENGFGLVIKGGKRNFIRNNGELLLKDVWADRAGDFMGSTAPLIINGERYEVDTNGNIR